MSPQVYVALAVVVGTLALVGGIIWASVRYGRAQQLAEDQAKVSGVERALVDVVEDARRHPERVTRDWLRGGDGEAPARTPGASVPTDDRGPAGPDHG